MELEIQKNGNVMTLIICGRVDTTTAGHLENTLRENWNGVTELELDFTDVSYISSAGLRVVIMAAKHMAELGKMQLRNVCGDVKNVFEMTGFDDFLHFV